MTDIVIGAADNYAWNDIKIWAVSLVQSGFSGKKVLIVYRTSDPTLIPNATNLGFEVVIAEHDEFGQPIDHHRYGLPTQAHKMRNFHAWQYLDNLDAFDANQEYIDWKTVGITDTRDIVFQTNPSEFFDKLEYLSGIQMPSENVSIEDEPWNRSMIDQLYGPYVLEEIAQQPACNSGTFFGSISKMKRFLLLMYNMERTFNTTGSDQPTMNVLGHLTPFVNRLQMSEGYAVQCGTVLDPTKQFPLIEPLMDILLPSNDGILRTPKTNKPYCIVHQYDRVPGLREAIEKRYA